MSSVDEAIVANFGDIRLTEQSEARGAVLSIETRALMGNGKLHPPVHGQAFLEVANLVKLRDGLNQVLDHLSRGNA